MAVIVRVPMPLRKFTNQQAKVEASGSDVRSVIDALNAQFPGIKERVCDDEGKPRNFVNIYLNGEDIRYLDGLSSAVNDGDELSIVPAVAGGA